MLGSVSNSIASVSAKINSINPQTVTSRTQLKDSLQANTRAGMLTSQPHQQVSQATRQPVILTQEQRAEAVKSSSRHHKGDTATTIDIAEYRALNQHEIHILNTLANYGQSDDGTNSQFVEFLNDQRQIFLNQMNPPTKRVNFLGRQIEVPDEQTGCLSSRIKFLDKFKNLFDHDFVENDVRRKTKLDNIENVLFDNQQIKSRMREKMPERYSRLEVQAEYHRVNPRLQSANQVAKDNIPLVFKSRAHVDKLFNIRN